jgi:2-hydroxy-3-keto-5-methylthiopentenyl-1-phosphate phosphatase
VGRVTPTGAHMNLRTLELAKTTVFIDFDGTISEFDVGQYLLARLAPGRWEEVDRRYERGEIGSRQYVTELWKVLPMDLPLLQVVADEVPLDPGLGPLVDFLRQKGAEVVVISDGLGIYVASRCAPWGLPVVTNELVDGLPVFPFGDPTCSCGLCGTCKPAQIRAAQAKGRTCVLVGDGTSDRFGAVQADLVFAKGRLTNWCVEEDVAFIPFEVLDDVRKALGPMNATSTKTKAPSDHPPGNQVRNSSRAARQ